MNNILVTGAAGYIGSMLCTKLVENKKNFVTAVDLLKYDKNSLSPNLVTPSKSVLKFLLKTAYE